MIKIYNFGIDHLMSVIYSMQKTYGDGCKRKHG